MFVLDPSLTTIKAGEPGVVAIHRSTEAVAVSAGEPTARLSYAYVCAIREGETTMVYLALEQTERKKILVYRPDPPPGEGALDPALLREALDLAASLGFAMQEINLNYSKAMREVVIRDIHVISRPSADQPMPEPPAAPAKERGGAAKETPKPAAADIPEAAAPASAPAPEPEPVGRRKGAAEPSPVASLEVEAERLAAERKRLEEEAAAAKTALQTQIERLTAENEELRRSQSAAEAALKNQLKGLADEKQRLESSSAEQLAALKEELARLRQEVKDREAAAAPEVASLKADLSALAAEKEHASELAMRQQSDLRAELKRVAAEKKQVERQAEEQLAALRAERDELAAAQTAAAAATAEQAGKLEDEIARLTRQTAAGEQGAAERVQALEAEIERLVAAKASMEQRAEIDQAALQETVARLNAETAEARQRAVRELAQLAVEAELLAAEGAAVERFIASHSGGGAAELLARAEAEVAALKGEVGRLAAEKSLAEQSAATRIAALQAELERHAGEGGAPKSRLAPAEPAPSPPAARRAEPAAAPVSTGKSATAPEWEEEVDAAVDMLASAEEPLAFPEGDDAFAGFGDSEPAGDFGSPALFRLDKNLTCIEYEQPEDFIALQHALNMVNISPEGHLPQTCGAYICALRRGEAFLVYVAWLLTVDKKTLVYAPDKQPESETACRKVVRDAVAFVETVGFMMDAIRLSSDPDKRLRALTKVPVLCRKE